MIGWAEQFHMVQNYIAEVNLTWHLIFAWFWHCIYLINLVLVLFSYTMLDSDTITLYSACFWYCIYALDSVVAQCLCIKHIVFVKCQKAEAQKYAACDYGSECAHIGL